MAVWQLDDELWFPNPRWGEDNGLVAIGGDLSADRLLLAYRHGFFPWYAFNMEREPHWYCPLDRYVIFPEEIHVSHTMRQLLRQQKYQVTVNEDFAGVIHGCSTAQGRNEQNGAWLGPDIIDAYTRLHHLGYATSVEVWQPTDNAQGRSLVGGLYGVTLNNFPAASHSAISGEPGFSKILPGFLKIPAAHHSKNLEPLRQQPDGTRSIGAVANSRASSHSAISGEPDGTRSIGAFFGESMFSLVPNASKLALIHLAKTMAADGSCLIDCQFETPLFKSMGGRHITYDEYMRLLRGINGTVT